jgi:hypothetical protein
MHNLGGLRADHSIAVSEASSLYSIPGIGPTGKNPSTPSAETRYTLRYGSLALSFDPVRHFHLGLQRVVRASLQAGIRQGHVCAGVPKGVLSVSVPRRAAIQDRGERIDAALL